MSLIIYGFLVLLCLCGLLGMFFFSEYVRKISCLSVAYVSFLIFVIFLSFGNQKSSEVFSIMMSVLMVFCVNLLIAISLAKKAKEADRKLN